MGELRYTKDGVPIYDGTSENYVSYRRAALVYVETLEWRKRALAGPRLQAALEGSARTAVQHKMPGWVSHQEGAVVLLDFLKTQVQPPTLAEAGKMISRFFYSVKRRKGESMQQWLVRHDESLFEARRALAEAIQEYGIGDGHTQVSTARALSTVPSRSPPRSEVPAPEVPFGEDGRMRETTADDDLTTVSGTGMSGSSHPGGLAVIKDGGPRMIGMPLKDTINLGSMKSQMLPALRLIDSCLTSWWLGCCSNVLG